MQSTRGPEMNPTGGGSGRPRGIAVGRQVPAGDLRHETLARCVGAAVPSWHTSGIRQQR